MSYDGMDAASYSRTSCPESSQTVVLSAVQTEITSGPLPHPELLKGYDEVIPNGADRIMKMAEKEQSERLARQELSLKASVKSKNRGQIMAFALAILILAIFVAMVYAGHSSSAYVIVGAGCLSIVGLFLDVLKKK